MQQGNQNCWPAQHNHDVTAPGYGHNGGFMDQLARQQAPWPIGNQFAAQEKLIRDREQQLVAREVQAAKQKATNPKQLYGDKKPPVHLIHQIAELHESAALHAGKRKYGENNYLQTEVEAMTYVGAILRHVKAWASGERVDPKELVHHLGAVKACCTILMTTESTGMLIDNRPLAHNGSAPQDCRAPATYQQATAETLAEVERCIEHLNKLYPNLL